VRAVIQVSQRQFPVPVSFLIFGERAPSSAAQLVADGSEEIKVPLEIPAA